MVPITVFNFIPRGPKAAVWSLEIFSSVAQRGDEIRLKKIAMRIAMAQFVRMQCRKSRRPENVQHFIIVLAISP